MLLRVIVMLIIVGVLLWGVSAILPLLPINHTVRTVIWVICVVAAVITVAQSLAGPPSWWKWGGGPPQGGQG